MKKRPTYVCSKLKQQINRTVMYMYVRHELLKNNDVQMHRISSTVQHLASRTRSGRLCCQAAAILPSSSPVMLSVLQVF